VAQWPRQTAPAVVPAASTTTASQAATNLSGVCVAGRNLPKFDMGRLEILYFRKSFFYRFFLFFSSFFLP
jgi:hypothetical protein